MKSSISNRQMFFLLLLTLTAYVVISIPKVIAQSAGTGGWFTLMITSLFFATFATVIVRLNSAFPGMTLFEYSQRIVGKTIAYILVICFIIYLLSFSIYLNLQLAAVLRADFYPKTPQWAMTLVSVLVFGIIVYQGPISVARFYEIIGTIFVITAVTTHIVMLLQGNLWEVQPFFRFSKLPDYLLGIKDCLFAFLGIELLTVFPFSGQKTRRSVRTAFLTVLFGKRSKANVAMFYIEDIANNKVVTLMKQRIEAIDVDGIGDSGELEVFLQNSNLSLFPQMGVVERSDMAQHLLHEGKVLVLVDGSGLALSAPKCFPEFFFSCDDRYDNMYFGLFMRILRYASFFIALYATCFYVGISEFHIDALPSRYVISLAEMRANVPFAPIIGGLLLEFVVELLREALLRVPKQIGPAVGIVSAIVIGQAAISAGIFSPLLLILASTSLLASFAMPDFALINSIRILKFIAILCTGFLGFYGLVLFSCVLLIHLVSIESFGVPYFAPFAPFNWYDFMRSFIYNISISPLRPKFLKNKDTTRTRT